MRLAAAILLVGAAIVGSRFLHDYRVSVTPCSQSKIRLGFGHQRPPCGTKRKPGWVDPTALGIMFVGLAGAAAILTARRSRNPVPVR
jgi:hypothetical protein